MHEIDLIPQEYRSRRQIAGCLKRSALAGLALLVVNLGGFGIFFQRTQQIESDIGTLQTQKEISSRQREEIEELQDRRMELERQWQLLSGLRSGSAVEQIFMTVDKALTGEDIWFLNWKFRRAGSPAKPNRKTINSGYFIVIPAGDDGKPEAAWQIDTHMTIQGEALDHSALSSFVKRLISQPGIQGVRVLNSTLQRGSDSRLVAFSLAVTVTGGMDNG